MPGQNDRRDFWTLRDQTFASEAEYREEQERRLTELLELLDTEDVMNANRQYALDLKYGKANDHQNGPANGHTKGQVSTATAEQERCNEELFKQLEAECAASLEEYQAQAASNGQTRGPANGQKNAHKHGRLGGGGAPRSGSPRVFAPIAERPGLPQSGAPRPHSASVDGPPPAKKQFRLLTGAQLNSGQFETRYLIPGLLIAGQPGGIFGSFKTLKTSLAADLMISLASGTPFLGRFPVPEPGKVLFLSGESGLPALQSIARRICTERGLSLDSLDNFRLSPDLLRFDRPADVQALKQLVEAQKPVCVVIDPAYLAIGGHHSRNLFAMGQLLRPLTELCESTGCTVLVVHHCKRSNKVGDPATLDDVAGSGFAEFSAQWLLLSRRRQFDPGTGKHELWLTGGSRAGHHGLWELDVDEGTLDQSSINGDGRIWKTALRTVASAEAQADERLAAAGEERRLRRRAVAFGHQRQRVWELLAAYPDGCNATVIRDALGINGERMKRILQVLVDEGVVQKTEEQIDRRRMKVTYQRIPHVMDFSDAAIQARRTHPPDQKVYEVRSGHFVDRGTQLVVPLRDAGALPPLDVALPPNARVWWDTRPGSESSVGNDLGANRSDSTPATYSDARDVASLKSGPDTLADSPGTQGVPPAHDAPHGKAALPAQPPPGGDRA